MVDKEVAERIKQKEESRGDLQDLEDNHQSEVHDDDFSFDSGLTFVGMIAMENTMRYEAT